MTPFILLFNFFAACLVCGALVQGPPITIPLKWLLLACLIVFPPLDFWAYFNGKPGVFSRLVSNYVRLAFSSRMGPGDWKTRLKK